MKKNPLRFETTTTAVVAVLVASIFLCCCHPTSAFVNHHPNVGSSSVRIRNQQYETTPITTTATQLRLARQLQDKEKKQQKQQSKTTPTTGTPSFDPFGLSKTKSNTNGVNGFSSSDSKNLVVQSTDTIESTKTGGDLNIWAARGLLLLVAAIWGTNFASVKYLENLCFHPPCHHPPSEAALARFGVAALVSLPLLFKQQWNVVKAGFECGLWITLGYISQALALSTIPSGECAFICSLTVVFVPLASAALYGKPIKPATLLAAAVALLGVGVLEGLVDYQSILGLEPASAADVVDAVVTTTTTTSATAITTALSSSSVDTAAAAVTSPLGALANWIGVGEGDILALGQPIGFGSAFLRIEHVQEELKDVPNRVLTIAAAQCVSVGLMAFLWVLYDFHGTIPDFSYMMEPHRIAAIGWTGIVTTVFAIFLEGIALQTATATDASIAFTSEPVWASMFGFWLLSEQLEPNAYIGGAIILLACLVGAASDLQEQNQQQKQKEDDLLATEYRP